MHIHTHFRSGVKVKERGTCEKVPVTFTLVFPLIFGDFFAVRASRKKFIVCATNYCCRPGIGLGWAAGQIDRWLFFFGFLFFSIQATGERGRCVDNDNNNNNNVTRVDSSRSLSRYDGYYYHHHHHTSELLLLRRAEQYSKKEKIKTTSRTLGLTDVHHDSQ